MPYPQPTHQSGQQQTTSQPMQPTKEMSTQGYDVLTNIMGLADQPRMLLCKSCGHHGMTETMYTAGTRSQCVFNSASCACEGALT